MQAPTLSGDADCDRGSKTRRIALAGAGSAPSQQFRPTKGHEQSRTVVWLSLSAPRNRPEPVVSRCARTPNRRCPRGGALKGPQNSKSVEELIGPRQIVRSPHRDPPYGANQPCGSRDGPFAHRLCGDSGDGVTIPDPQKEGLRLAGQPSIRESRVTATPPASKSVQCPRQPLQSTVGDNCVLGLRRQPQDQRPTQFHNQKAAPH